MGIAGVILIAGICVMVGAFEFLLKPALSAAKRERRLGGRQDLYMGCFWTGMLLVQAANILQHIQPDGTYKISALTLEGTAASVLFCGMLAGRLLLRGELRRFKKKREELDRAASA